ncbi:MAG: 4a-hydroxytetrahydrobiopterin dehydratase [Dehalococcoidia bacterium]
MASPARLTDEQITHVLADLDGWEHDGDQITHSFEFRDFSEAFGFLARVALLQEQADHHAEVWSVYDRVRLTLSTHDAGGITQRDIDLAMRINALRG